MLCDRESLFTNSTREPAAIWTFCGVTPPAVIVIVFVGTGGPLGAIGESELHAAASTSMPRTV
jgi:hypothetical protein